MHRDVRRRRIHGRGGHDKAMVHGVIQTATSHLSSGTGGAGAVFDDDNGSDSGSAYVFDLNCPRDCPADLDGNGVVDFGDIIAILSAWGPCKDCPEDLDESGAVDFGDVLVVLTAYVFLSLDRLAVLGERLDAGKLRAKYEPVNNLRRQFEKIQRDARARLAEQRGVDVSKVEWPIGSVHDLRRTYITEMADHVDVITLTRWVGHADPKTTMQYYHRTKSAAADKARTALSGLYGPRDYAPFARTPDNERTPSTTATPKAASRYNQAALSA